MRYCLLKIAYDDSFYGFQVQPNLITVQGEILKALSPIGVRKVYGSSRTDSHVRSSSSVIEVEHEDALKVCKIVDSIKGIAVRGFYETDEFVNLRKSLEKEYLFFCDRSLSKRSLNKAVREFLKGDLKSFSRDPTKEVILTGIQFLIEKTHTIFLFKGRAFSWNFVRIAAETIIKRSEGKIANEEWLELLSGKKRSRYRGKPDNLILFRTTTPFEFKNYDSKKLIAFRSRVFQEFYWLVGMDNQVGEMTDYLNFLERK